MIIDSRSVIVAIRGEEELDKVIYPQPLSVRIIKKIKNLLKSMINLVAKPFKLW